VTSLTDIINDLWSNVAYQSLFVQLNHCSLHQTGTLLFRKLTIISINKKMTLHFINLFIPTVARPVQL